MKEVWHIIRTTRKMNGPVVVVVVVLVLVVVGAVAVEHVVMVEHELQRVENLAEEADVTQVNELLEEVERINVDRNMINSGLGINGRWSNRTRMVRMTLNSCWIMRIT